MQVRLCSDDAPHPPVNVATRVMTQARLVIMSPHFQPSIPTYFPILHPMKNMVMAESADAANRASYRSSISSRGMEVGIRGRIVAMKQ